ncbi:MAG: zinc-dependent peptidase [Candidatus Dactylopiibacterium sp.]|nr:zinc-dependent peptidase [Candidatus Dactylopiibacterium sp.]
MPGFLQRIFRRAPAPEALAAPLWEAVEAAQPWLSRLTPAERARLRELALAFLDQKVFSGANGFEPDNTVRLSIALQACLPVLELGLEAYAGWRGIIVYAGDFMIPRRVVDDDGVLHEYDEEALGEAWHGGPVVLSWFDDARELEGIQVVIHEFAHKLDMLNGEADGLPPLHAGMSEEAWCAAFDAAFDDLCARDDAGLDTALDPYAAEHPAEFFAVASESFFTEPDVLAQAYPAVYRQLVLFYRIDLRDHDRGRAFHTKI